MTESVLALKEGNDPQRQARLRARAYELCEEISIKRGVVAVLLTGSVARGIVGNASDLDLHVVVTPEFQERLPVWTFRDTDLIENVHTLPQEQLVNALQSLEQPQQLASIFCQTRIADELTGSRSLFWSADNSLKDQLLKVTNKRLDADVVRHLVRMHGHQGRQLLMRAEKALDDLSIRDAHQQLRWAVQSLLIAALIRRGWIIRGSKKRIEIAHSFLPDPLIEPLLQVALDVVGLRCSRDRANTICEMRNELRFHMSNELKAIIARTTLPEEIMIRLQQLIEFEERHNASAFNYYKPLINQGMCLGPVNHLRALSGFALIPNRLLFGLGADEKMPVQSFLNCEHLSKTIKDVWLEVADLSNSAELCRTWLKELMQLSSALTD